MKLNERIKESREYKNFKLLIENDKLSHAYLIHSENDALNKEFCRALAAMVLGKEVFPSFHPDVFEYPKDKKLVVEESKAIIENISKKPMVGNFNIVIISNLELATQQAQNKLLKTIEEGVEGAIFLFNTTNKNKVLQTILSRVQDIDVSNVLKEDLTQEKNYDFIIDLIKNLKSSRDILDYSIIFANKNIFLNNLKILEFVFDQMLLYNGGVNPSNPLDVVFNEYSANAIGVIFNLITQARKEFEANVNVSYITDNLLYKILEAKHYEK